MIALHDLARAAGVPVSGPDCDVRMITADSRKIVPGALFAALKGTKSDGLQFVPQAIAGGAVAILADRPPADLPEHVALITADEPRAALSKLAAAFYTRQPETIVAVTGTSGKTSVASFARQIFANLGYRAGSIGTLGVVAPGREGYGSLTTPDPVELHKTLAELAGEGVSHIAMEASSHGLDQYRLDGVRLAAAGFTNLSRDHLDYHPSVEAYLQAKLRLVTELLPQGKTVVINADGASSDAFKSAATARGLSTLTVGAAGSDLRMLDRRRLPGGQGLSLSGSWGRAELLLPLVGDFQAANALVAAGLALATGEPIAKVLAAVEQLSGVVGRLDKVGDVRGAAVYVDYAHKPDALENVLAALRPYTTGRLIVAFGCGGDRDAGKRPMMGQIAAEKADIVIVTDDNPRSELPASIRAAILSAAPGAMEIGDRASAIHTGIELLRPGDVFIIAGKGHEPGQIIGSTVFPFSDHEVARAAIEALR